MKTINISNRSRELKELLKKAKKESLIVQTPEGDEFMLSPIDEFDLEIARQRQNKALMKFLDERARAALNEPTIPLEEVRRRFGLTKRTDNGKKSKSER